MAFHSPFQRRGVSLSGLCLAGTALLAPSPAALAWVPEPLIDEVAAEVAAALLADPTVISPTSASITVWTDVKLGSVTDGLRASNTPAWLNADTYLNPQGFADYTDFKQRTQYSGAGWLRIPGGSWSDKYGGLACEIYRAKKLDPSYNFPYGNGSLRPCGPSGTDWGNWAAVPSDFIKFLRATGKQAMYTLNVNASKYEAAATVAFFRFFGNSHGRTCNTSHVAV